MEDKNKYIEVIETSDEAIVEIENKKSFKDILSPICDFFKNVASLFKGKNLKNEALFKRGGYSLAITAVVLAGLIVFNWLVGVLGDRFHLEFDMTANKKNSISAENIEYIKSIDNDIKITIIGSEENYSNYVSYYAQNLYGVTISSNSELEYFEQTKTLISKYKEYNDKISIEYIDPQSTQYTAITTAYPSYEFVYGDMIVECSFDGNERTKILTFYDLYALSEDSSSSYYGYSSYTLASNKTEQALTGAIAYVTSTDTKKVAVISGHSSSAYIEAYKSILTANNYDITEISDNIVSEISSDYDAIIISAPNIDFLGSELDVISEFLDNDGKLGKGLVFFADATSPYLTNLYGFLEEWGISVGEGIVYETYSGNHIPDTPTAMGIYLTELENDDITTNMSYAIADYNVPMNICETATTTRTATALMQTPETTVVAPIGFASDWADYTEDDMKAFDCVIQSVETGRDSENNQITSYVMAFSGLDFIQSTYASDSNLCNQDIVMAVSDRATHVGDTPITFTSKVIENENFTADVTDSGCKIVSTVFMFIIPVLVAVIGIVIFVRRRNAR